MMTSSKRLLYLFLVAAPTAQEVASFVVPQTHLPVHNGRHQTDLTKSKARPTTTRMLVSPGDAPLDLLSSLDVNSFPTSDVNSFLNSCSQLLLAADAKASASSSSNYLGTSFGTYAIISLTLLFVIFVLQKALDYLRYSIPYQLTPVVDSILAQIAGLGIVTLSIQSFFTMEGSKKFLKDISKQLTTNAGFKIQITADKINHLQHGFMELGVIAAVVASLMIISGLKQLRDVEELQNLTYDPQTGECDVDPEALSAYMYRYNRRAREQLPGNISVWREIFRDSKERAARVLVMRLKVMELYPYLSNTFRVENFILESFANNLYQITQFVNRNPIPLFVIFFIPAMAVVDSILFGEPRFGSPLHVGEFVSTPWCVWPATASVVFGGMWGNWNCYKLTQVKKVTFPRLSFGDDRIDFTYNQAYGQPGMGGGGMPGGGRPMIMKPLMDDPGFREYYYVTGNVFFEAVERLFAKPPRTGFDDMFGTIGAAGLDFYRNSIQYQVSLCLTQLIVFGSVIVPRDIDALTSGMKPTASSMGLASAELFVFAGYLGFTLIQLLFVAPRSFWNLCLVSCLEEYEDNMNEEPPPPPRRIQDYLPRPRDTMETPPPRGDSGFVPPRPRSESSAPMASGSLGDMFEPMAGIFRPRETRAIPVQPRTNIDTMPSNRNFGPPPFSDFDGLPPPPPRSDFNGPPQGSNYNGPPPGSNYDGPPQRSSYGGNRGMSSGMSLSNNNDIMSRSRVDPRPAGSNDEELYFGDDGY